MNQKQEWLRLNHPWDIFRLNGEVLQSDFVRLTDGKTSAKLNDTNVLIGDEIFLEEGVAVNGAILNADKGPIYLGKDAEIMEGVTIRGPFSLGDHAVVKMGAKIYGPTTIGPYCKVGGEISNSILQAYSNKGHDGFLGNSVIGEWCNLGADTNSSNLKNNYGEVRVWDYEEAKSISTGLQFCGLIMGDHSKSGINTMFNTGTVVGVCANIFGAQFPPKFIPSFLWGGSGQWDLFKMEKAIEVAEKMMSRRQVTFSSEDEKIFQEILRLSQSYREDFLS